MSSSSATTATAATDNNGTSSSSPDNSLYNAATWHQYTEQQQHIPITDTVPNNYYHDNNDDDDDNKASSHEASSESSESSSSESEDDLPDFEILEPLRRNYSGDADKDTADTIKSEKDADSRNGQQQQHGTATTESIHAQQHHHTEEINLDSIIHSTTTTTGTQHDNNASASTTTASSIPTYKPHSSFASFLESNPIGDSIKSMLLKMNYDVNKPTSLGRRRDGIVNPLMVDRDRVTGVASVHHDEDERRQQQRWKEGEESEDGIHSLPSDSATAGKSRGGTSKQSRRKPNRRNKRYYEQQHHDTTITTSDQDSPGIPHLPQTKKRRQLHNEQMTMEKQWKRKKWRKSKGEYVDGSRGSDSGPASALQTPSTTTTNFVDFNGETIDLTSTATEKKPSMILPEFHYNMNHLLDACEMDIHNLENKIQRETDKQEAWKHERNSLHSQIETAESTMDSFEEVLKIFDDAYERMTQTPVVEGVQDVMMPDAATTVATDRYTTTTATTEPKQQTDFQINQQDTTTTTTPKPLTLLEWNNTFAQIQFKYPQIFKQFELYKSGLAIALPLLRQFFKDWDPFESYSPVIDSETDTKQEAAEKQQRQAHYNLSLEQHQMMKEWKSLLVSYPEEYESLVSELLLPKIRERFLSWKVDQQVRQASSFLNMWSSILPPKLLSHILNQLILPRIVQFVQQWTPEREKPIHLYLFPWLPHLGKEFESYGLYSVVSHRIVNTLKNWKGSEKWAHEIIMPWKDILQPKDLNNLLSIGVLPHLRTHLKRMEFSVQNQDYTPLEDVLMWEDVFPTALLLRLLERSFFSRWLKVLYGWLSAPPSNSNTNGGEEDAPFQSRKDYGKLTIWISQWKSIFSDDLRLDPFVMQQFQYAQQMLNEAISGQEITPFHQTASKMKPTRADGGKIPPGKRTAASAFVPHRLSFKELLQRYCAKYNMNFRPLHNSQYQGHQLYTFGPIPCFIEAQCLWIQEEVSGGGGAGDIAMSRSGGRKMEWNPVSLAKIRDCALREKK